jgi:ABC-type Zn uptake system ZnuABC Zn-binding protein ZnuA
MKRLLLIPSILFLCGCTQVVTAPIYLTGAVVTTTIDIAGSAVHAVSGSSDKEKEKEDENEER